MTSVPVLKPMSSADISNDGVLRYREYELDRALLNNPKVIAQRVERELVKRLQITAPWLLPLVIKL
ncbi:hypothetical protein KAR91_47800 [Candidatus Pacearchaeota archaeon]|nr:hypothetical protein [Candidatus Pacearchaeota archaeon]